MIDIFVILYIYIYYSKKSFSFTRLPEKYKEDEKDKMLYSWNHIPRRNKYETHRITEL